MERGRGKRAGDGSSGTRHCQTVCGRANQENATARRAARASNEQALAERWRNVSTDRRIGRLPCYAHCRLNRRDRRCEPCDRKKIEPLQIERTVRWGGRTRTPVAAIVARAVSSVGQNRLSDREVVSSHGFSRDIMGVIMLMIASAVTRPHGLALLNSMLAFSMQMPAAAHREVEQRGK